MATGQVAWVGGRDFIPHPTIGELMTEPTMMDDQIALPALRLILGDYKTYEARRGQARFVKLLVDAG